MFFAITETFNHWERYQLMLKLNHNDYATTRFCLIRFWLCFFKNKVVTSIMNRILISVETCLK